MTYTETKKEINRLYNELNKRDKTMGEYVLVNERGVFQEFEFIPNEEKRKADEEIKAQIKILEKEIEEEENRRYIKAKIRRYRKELEEIKNREKYLEKWLKENAGLN